MSPVQCHFYIYTLAFTGKKQKNSLRKSGTSRVHQDQKSMPFCNFIVSIGSCNVLDFLHPIPENSKICVKKIAGT